MNKKIIITKPMLAVAADLNKIQYPIFALKKLDGIRCLMIDGVAVSRNFKPIRNKHIQKMMKGLPDGLDGELIVDGGFNATSSAVMSVEGEPEFTYAVFDYVKGTLETPWKTRYTDYMALEFPDFCSKVSGVILYDSHDLNMYETGCLLKGYEGIMLRSLKGQYKCGRSTLRQGWLLKLKRFKDDEATIIGFDEKITNNNTLEKDELGHAKRSTKKEGMVPAGVLGAFVAKDKNGLEFRVATGLNDKIRKEVWDNKDKYLGKMLKFRYQEVTEDGKYRFPSFLGFRDKADL